MLRLSLLWPRLKIWMMLLKSSPYLRKIGQPSRTSSCKLVYFYNIVEGGFSDSFQELPKQHPQDLQALF